MVEFANMPSKDKEAHASDENPSPRLGTSSPNGSLKRRAGDARGR